MNKIYVISINTGDHFDSYDYILEGYFTSHENAEVFLLEHFYKESDYYVLKEGHDYLTRFCEDDVVTIIELDLIK